MISLPLFDLDVVNESVDSFLFPQALEARYYKKMQRVYFKDFYYDSVVKIIVIGSRLPPAFMRYTKYDCRFSHNFVVTFPNQC